MNLRTQENTAGRNATTNKDHVIGVVLRDFVAPKTMIGQTLQTDVMALLAEKDGMNVLYYQVNELLEALT